MVGASYELVEAVEALGYPTDHPSSRGDFFVSGAISLTTIRIHAICA